MFQRLWAQLKTIQSSKVAFSSEDQINVTYFLKKETSGWFSKASILYKKSLSAISLTLYLEEKIKSSIQACWTAGSLTHKNHGWTVSHKLNVNSIQYALSPWYSQYSPKCYDFSSKPSRQDPCSHAVKTALNINILSMK